jgi:hypothetical protein
MNEEINNLLSIYYDTKNSASFGTVQKLYKEAKKLKSDLKLTQVKKWL